MLSVPGVGEDAPARYGILTTEGFAVYDDTGSLSFKISDNGGTSAILDTDTGLLFLSENKQGKQSLRQIDTTVGKLGAEITLPEELTAHWRELVASLSLECIYIGREDPQRLCALLRETVGAELGERSVTPYRAPVRAVPNRNRLQPRTVEEEMAVMQCHLVLGFCTDCTLNDPAHRACLLFNEMLGASPISKLFVNVRERLSLCYSCGSSYQPYKGTLTVYCGLGDENRAIAMREIMRQVKAIAKGGPVKPVQL